MIKKTMFTVLVCLLCTLAAKAQITKGNWMVGGNGSYVNQTYSLNDGNEDKYVEINLKPTVGYFIRDKYAVGVSLRYSYLPVAANNNNLYGIGLFTRYYFLEQDKMFNIFAQLHYDYLLIDANLTANKLEHTSFFGGKIGQVLFLNNSVGLELALEYERTIGQFYKSNTYRAVIGFQIHLEKK